MNFTISFSQLIERLRAMDRTLILAFVVSAFVLLYSGNLGLEWWGDTKIAESLDAQAEQLQMAARNMAREQASPDTSVAQRMQALEDIVGSYSFESDDAVIGLVYRIAREARVTAKSVSTSDGGLQTKGPLTYRVRTASIRVEGPAQRLLTFIDDLSLATPGLTVTAVRMGGFDGAPWAQLDATFLINPVPDQEGG